MLFYMSTCCIVSLKYFSKWNKFTALKFCEFSVKLCFMSCFKMLLLQKLAKFYHFRADQDFLAHSVKGPTEESMAFNITFDNARI